MKIRRPSKTPTLSLVALATGLLYAFASGAQTGQDAQSVCPHSTWSNCGVAVKNDLAKLSEPLAKSDVGSVVKLMELWSDSYSQRLRFLQQNGVHQGENDWTKIREAVTDKLTDPVNPFSIAKDKALEAVLRRLPTFVSTFLEYAEAPVAGITTFFDSSTIGDDFKELNLINDDLQRRFAAKLEPFLRDDWQKRLQDLSVRVAPQLKRLP
jgi:hypothetical protein